MTSQLAKDIYLALQPRVPSLSIDPRLTYSDLVELLPGGYGISSPRDVRLNSAYAEIVAWCTSNDLAPITAILVSAETRTPGAGYYDATHPLVKDEAERLVKWALDYEKARVTTYPAAIDD